MKGVWVAIFRWRWAAFFVLLAIALFVDVVRWQQQAIDNNIERLYLHTYPARKLYARYIRPYQDAQGQYPLNTLQLLGSPTGILQESRAAVYAVALLDMRHGELPLVFPDAEPFRQASFSVVGWDGLSIVSGQAYGKRYTVPDAGFQSVFLFLRLPKNPAGMDVVAPNTLLSMVGVGEGAPGAWDFGAVRCAPSTPDSWLDCESSLLAAAGMSAGFLEQASAYREGMGNKAFENPVSTRPGVKAAEASLSGALRHNVGYLTASRWWVYRDFFRVDESTVNPLLAKAAFFAAPFLPVPDSKAKVALKYDDDNGQYIKGSQGDYTLVFSPAQLSPETLDWSFTVYERNKPGIWTAEKPAVTSKADAVVSEDGRVSLYFSRQRPDDVPLANWLPLPAGEFMVVYRAYTRTPLDRYDDFSALSKLERQPLPTE